MRREDALRMADVVVAWLAGLPLGELAGLLAGENDDRKHELVSLIAEAGRRRAGG